MMRRRGDGRRAARGAAALALVLAGGLGCASRGPAALTPTEIDDGVSRLDRPLPGDLAALYSLRVASTGGLRLALLTAGDRGRMTISKPFGAAVSITAWSDEGPVVVLDLEQGCRREGADLADVLGVGALPLAQAVRLLGGRLPAVAGDRVTPGGGDRVVVAGTGWAATVRLARDPWRVLEVDELRPDGSPGWRLELGNHASSVPGTVRLEDPEGRWAELELTRLEWPDEARLPELPSLEPCRGR